jgi:hypothetical protein
MIPTEKVSGRHNGFYVMRNHRQIMGAERLGFTLDKASGHYANFRAELLFDGKYDEIFKTNVMKNRIILPQALIDLMKDDVDEYRKYCVTQRKKDRPEEKKADENVRKELDSIFKKKNDKKSTPTVLTTKTGIEIKTEKIEGIDDTDETDDKKKINGRGPDKEKRKSRSNKKLVYDFVNFGENGSFFTAHHLGNGKYLIRINCDHKFYDEFARLDRQGMDFMIDILHTFSLASRQELMEQGDDLDVIDELIQTWSNFLRRSLNEN